MKGIGLLKAFIKEEIGRNYHTLHNDPHTWDSFQDYEITYAPTGSGKYSVSISFKGEELVPTSEFKNETECKHFARMIVDKHRVYAMNER